MKNYIYSLFFLLSFVFCLYSQIPQTLSYQGVLQDAGGNIVPNGTYQLTFNLYYSSSGGTALWTETQMVPVADGIFNVILGAVTPLTITFDVPYWLGVTVGTGGELSPRIRLTSSAYSLNARSVADNAVSTVKIQDGAVTQAKLAPGVTLPPGGTAGGDLTGTYPNPAIATNAVTTAKINDGAVTQAKLAPGVNLPPGGTAGGDLSGTYPNPTVDGLQGRSVVSTAPTSGQVMKWNGSSWGPGDDNAGTGLTLPYTGSANNPGANTFYITNTTTSNGDAIVGKQGNGSTIGSMTSAAIWGTAEFGHGVVGYGSNAGGYAGVLGATNSPSGYGIRGSATSSYGVYGTATSAGGYGVYGSGQSGATGGYFSSETGAALVTGSGNVGIGVSSPERKLQVDGDIGVGYSDHFAVGAFPGLWWNSTTTGCLALGWQSPHNLEFYAGSAIPRMTLLSTKGLLGVGTPMPQGRLHAHTNGRYAGYFTSDSLSDLTHAIHAVYLGVGFHDGVGIYAKSVPAAGFGFGGIFEGGYYAARMDGNLWINGTYDSYFRPNFSGNSAVVLPDNAIASPEMLDEPGIASQLNGSSITLNSTVMQDLQTISITLPAPGYVVLNAKSYIRFSGTTSGVGARIQIDQTAGGGSLFPYYQFIYFPALQSTSIHSFPVSVQRTYYFAAGGLQTFRLEGARETSNGTTESWDHIITAVYYPTSYGSVTEMVEYPGGNPEARLITTNRPAENNEPNSVYEVDLRYYELQAAKARAEAEKAERELMEARAKISTQ